MLCVCVCVQILRVCMFEQNRDKIFYLDSEQQLFFYLIYGVHGFIFKFKTFNLIPGIERFVQIISSHEKFS